MKAGRTESIAGYVLLIGMALATLLPFVSIVLGRLPAVR